jgi:hypothetical protein
MKKTKRTDGAPKKKRITWRQVSSCFSHRYGSIIWENVYNTQVVKIYTVHKEGDKWMVVKVQHLKNGVQQRVLNFQSRQILFDKNQLN